MTTPANMRWKIVDRETGAENAAIGWRVRVGDQVKIRIVIEMAGDHPMHHPFHVHGAGRILILSRDGVKIAFVVHPDFTASTSSALRGHQPLAGCRCPFPVELAGCGPLRQRSDSPSDGHAGDPARP